MIYSHVCTWVICNLVFAVNKMDLVDYSKTRFDEIQGQINILKNELSLDSVHIIPVSATEGDNVTVKSDNMPWYSGISLLEYLEKIDTDSENKEEGFYMPVQRVCRPDHTFRGFQGQIEAGGINVGEEITTLPSNEKARVKSIFVAGKEESAAFVGQPVTITLDKEVDVSRGCVIVKNTNIAPYKRLTVSLLWMDDEPLTIGRDYLVKLGTKTISAIPTKLKYAVDVNTGEHIQAESLTKNGIAVCELLLTEAIVADLFSQHKTLGELILINRVTNMTSACGVVENLSEKGGAFSDRVSFKSGTLEARGDIFEEFYYDNSSLNVLKYQPVNKTYTIGDEIPTKGESYKYPDSFDIIILRDGVAVKVRDRSIKEIIPTAEYKYGGVPIVNGRGFGVLASNDEEVSDFLKEYSQLNEEGKKQFFAKWVRFDTYRKVIIK